jgi:hypothetical protein
MIESNGIEVYYRKYDSGFKKSNLNNGKAMSEKE